MEEGRAIGRVKEGGVLGGWRRSSWWRREEQLVEWRREEQLVEWRREGFLDVGRDVLGGGGRSNW